MLDELINPQLSSLDVAIFGHDGADRRRWLLVSGFGSSRAPGFQDLSKPSAKAPKNPTLSLSKGSEEIEGIQPLLQSGEPSLLLPPHRGFGFVRLWMLD